MTIPHARPPARRRLHEWLLLLAFLALLGGFIAYAYFAEVDRVNATERERLQVQSNVIANDIQGNLELTSVAMQRVITDFWAPSQGWRAKESSMRLLALVDAMRGVRAMSVMNAQGVVVASSHTDLLGKGFSQRDYFQLVREKPSKTMFYISEPYNSV